MKSFKLFFSLFTLFLVSIASATVPQLINFQGRLTDSLGNPVSDGSYSLRFRIYDDSLAGNVLWEETDPVQISKGLFTVLLGSAVSIPDSAFYSANRWFGIKIGTNTEITPRQKLASVGYSFQSGQWNSLDSNLFRLNGNVGIGTSAPSAKLDVQTSAGIGVAANSGGTYGVYASGVYTGVSAGGGTYGVYGSGGSYGVYGSGGPYGVYGSGGSYGVYGRSTGTAAVFGDIGGNFGTYGGYFQGDVKVERNLVVNGTSYSSAGVNASSSSGAGVVASGFTNAVEATGGTRGVYATGSTFGIVAAGRYGAYGYSNYGTSVLDAGYAVFGESGNPNAWAGYFSGHCRITGTLTVDGLIYKNGGGFRIDHPTDPANKYLYHSFVESPDMKNIYDGIVTIDAKGEAIVTLPDWFDALNSDFRYQLTAIGAPGPNLFIAEEISGNHFKIGGGTPGMKVSWQVTGIRQDAYAKAHRIPVEEEKTGKERGRYLHPEEEGVSETLGMHYEETQKMTAEHKKMEEQRAKMEQELKGTDKK